MGLSLINGSNGVGEAVRASVTALRTAGSTTITVDAVTNWPASFIATSGKLVTSATGVTTLSGAFVFTGHLTGSTIVIDAMAPGYTDPGNQVNDVVLLKPSTLWADNFATTLATAHNDNGSLKTNAVTTASITDANVTTAKLADASVTNAKLATGAGQPGGAWQSWTPTWTTLTIGNAVVNCRYKQIGKTVTAVIQVTLGSTSSFAGGVPSFTLPVSAVSYIVGTYAGSLRYTSTGGKAGFIRISSATTADIITTTNTSITSESGLPAMSNADTLIGTFIYEAL